MKRYDCLVELASLLTDELVVLPVGMTGDEFEAVKPRDSNFRVQCMGAATPVGLGLALALPDRKIMALDADGGVLMNLGAVATVARVSPANLAVLVFDNSSYESVGNLPTATEAGTDLAAVARGAGVGDVESVATLEAFKGRVQEALAKQVLTYTVAKVERGSPETVQRSSLDGIERKYRFVRYVESHENRTILAKPVQKRRRTT